RLHDRGAGVFGALPDQLPDLPRAGRLGAVPWPGRGADDLPFDPPHSHRACGDRAGAGADHTVAGAAPSLSGPSAHRALDAADLALRLGDRDRRLLDALPGPLVSGALTLRGAR